MARAPNLLSVFSQNKESATTMFDDTVAVALMEARNLTKEEYAMNHPAGKIGKSLIFKVKDLMKKLDEVPICRESNLIMDQLVELTSKGWGHLLVTDDGYHLIGTFTDGDLCRTLRASGEAIFKLTVGEMCNRKSVLCYWRNIMVHIQLHRLLSRPFSRSWLLLI